SGSTSTTRTASGECSTSSSLRTAARSPRRESGRCCRRCSTSPSARSSVQSRSAPLRGVVLVEGVSDRRAVEALARRRGRDLEAEGVAIVPMGGYGNLPRLLGQYRDVRLAGLYDIGEERHFLRALGCVDRADLERVGFYACMRDLEEELTRAVGPDGMERVL